MIHLSSYHSNGLPTVVWNNKVNLIGEKVYKPKIHFCEVCDRPILVYGRLIPCKHVFCLTCATLCLAQTNTTSNNCTNSPRGDQVISLANNQSPLVRQSPPCLENNHRNSSNSIRKTTPSANEFHPRTVKNQRDSESPRSPNRGALEPRTESGTKDANLMVIDDSNSNTTPNFVQAELTNNSPRFSNTRPDGMGNRSQQGNNVTRGCHRCGNRALRVERNSLNSIFVCQVESCRRTYLSAKDLQAHVNHRHSRNKPSNNSSVQGPSTASHQAISSSPYISSSSLMHLKPGNSGTNNSNNNKSNTSDNNHRLEQQASTSIIQNKSSGPRTHEQHHGAKLNNLNQSSQHQNTSHKRDREQARTNELTGTNNQNNPLTGNEVRRDRLNERREVKERFREREREVIQRERDRERNSKEYHRQSMQRAAQWAEASAQMLEKGYPR